MIKINDYYQEFTKFPRHDRRTVEKLIKGIYTKGREDERKRIFNLTKRYYGKNTI